MLQPPRSLGCRSAKSVRRGSSAHFAWLAKQELSADDSSQPQQARVPIGQKQSSEAWSSSASEPGSGELRESEIDRGHSSCSELLSSRSPRSASGCLGAPGERTVESGETGASGWRLGFGESCWDIGRRLGRKDESRTANSANSGRLLFSSNRTGRSRLCILELLRKIRQPSRLIAEFAYPKGRRTVRSELLGANLGR